MEDSGEPACEEESAAEKEALDLCSVLTSVIGKLVGKLLFAAFFGGLY